MGTSLGHAYSRWAFPSSGEHHLGYSEAEMYGKSLYEILHPEDVHEAKEKHIQCKSPSLIRFNNPPKTLETNIR